VRADLAQKVRRARGLPDHLESRVPEQPHETVPQKGLILADDDPHAGIIPSSRYGLGDAFDSFRRPELP
jgi:hypothetical protein